MVGIFVTIASGLALVAARSWVKRVMDDLRAKKKRESSAGDEVHRVRYNKAGTIQHMGACHCQRVRFRVRAPRVINAVDVPSKIRFPRITVPCDFFEPLTDEALMSLYAIKTDPENKEMGVHTFCSYCGVHILYSPSVEPVEVQINVDCLDRSTIDHMYVSYLGVPETVPCPVSYDAARPFNRRGAGSLYVPILSDLCSPANAQQKQKGAYQQQPPYSRGSSGSRSGFSSAQPSPASNLRFLAGLNTTSSHKSTSSGGGGRRTSMSDTAALSAYYMGLGSSGSAEKSRTGTAVGDDSATVDGLFHWGLGGVTNAMQALGAGLDGKQSSSSSSSGQGQGQGQVDVDRYHHTLSPTPRKLRAVSDAHRHAPKAADDRWTPIHRQLRENLARYLSTGQQAGAPGAGAGAAIASEAGPRVVEMAS